jgi:hypothetical protein
MDVQVDSTTAELWREYRLTKSGLVAAPLYGEADAVKCDWWMKFEEMEADIRRRAEDRARAEAEAERGRRR